MNVVSLRFARLAGCVFVCGVGLSGTTIAQQPAAKGAAASVAEPTKFVERSSGSPEVDELVRGLVSSRPPLGREYAFDGPPGHFGFGPYLTPEVDASVRKLKALGSPIYPALIKHIGDERHSFSYPTSMWINQTVTDAIHWILSDGANSGVGYKGRPLPNGKSASGISFEEYIEAIGIERWADWAAKRTKAEIDLDYNAFCINEENRRGFVDSAQRDEILGTLERLRSKILAELKRNEATAPPPTSPQTPPQTTPLPTTPVPPTNRGSWFGPATNEGPWFEPTPNRQSWFGKI